MMGVTSLEDLGILAQVSTQPSIPHVLVTKDPAPAPFQVSTQASHYSCSLAFGFPRPRSTFEVSHPRHVPISSTLHGIAMLPEASRTVVPDQDEMTFMMIILEYAPSPVTNL